MEILMQEHHHDLSEVGDHGPVNGSCVISKGVPHPGEGVGNQVDNWNSCNGGGLEININWGEKSHPLSNSKL